MTTVVQRDDKPPMRTRTTRQIPAVGPLPDAETLCIGALLWSLPDDAAAVLALVTDDDIASPAMAAVLAVIRESAAAGGSYTPALVLDRLVCRGAARPEVRKALADAVTSGAASAPEPLRDYAAAVVAASLRRRIDSAGHALQVAADESAEGELPVIATRVASAAQGIADRLKALRGEPL